MRIYFGPSRYAYKAKTNLKSPSRDVECPPVGATGRHQGGVLVHHDAALLVVDSLKPALTLSYSYPASDLTLNHPLRYSPLWYIVASSEYLILGGWGED